MIRAFWLNKINKRRGEKHLMADKERERERRKEDGIVLGGGFEGEGTFKNETQ